MHTRTIRAMAEVLSKFDAGDEEAAGEYSRELLRVHPGVGEICLAMARQLMERELYEVSVCFLEVMNIVAPYDGRHWQLRAEIEQRIGDQQASARSLEIAAQRKKTAALVDTANHQFSTGQPQCALQNLQAAAQNDHTNFRLHMQLAERAHSYGAMNQSVESYLQAHRIDVQAYQPLLGLARVLFGLGKTEQSLEVLDQGMARAAHREPSMRRRYLTRSPSIVQYMTIKDWCNIQKHPFIQLVEPQRVTVREPPVLNPMPGAVSGDAKTDIVDETAPGLWIAELHQVEVVGSEAVLLADNTMLMYDPTLHPLLRQDNSDCQTGLVNGNQTVVTLPNEDPCVMHEAILLGGRACCNYFHWLTEFLPRLAIVESVSGYEHAPFLLPADLPPQMHESLDLLDKHNRGRVAMTRDTRIIVENLLVPSTTALLHDDRRMRKTLLMVVPAAVVTLRKMLNVPERIDRKKNRSRRVFMRRFVDKDIRQVVNEEEIADIFSEYGFESVDTGKMTFTQQLELFRECEAIVGAAGASFANMMLTPGGCTSVLLGSRHLGAPHLFDSIARVSQQSFVCIFGEAIENKDDYNQAHFSCWVDPDEARLSMDAIVQAIDRDQGNQVASKLGALIG